MALPSASDSELRSRLVFVIVIDFRESHQRLPVDAFVHVCSGITIDATSSQGQRSITSASTSTRTIERNGTALFSPIVLVIDFRESHQRHTPRRLVHVCSATAIDATPVAWVRILLVQP